MGRTIFVVGAGASTEVGLPVGSDLKNTIAQLLNYQTDDWRVTNRNVIYDALQSLTQRPGAKFNLDDLLETCWHIRDAMPQAPSIDNFIDVHRGNKAIELCGKLAIVKSILDAERGSRLRVDDRNVQSSIEFQHVGDTWFNNLFEFLVENCTVNELAERIKSIAFVVFNYDRCIEHYFYYALQNYYRITNSDAAALVRRMAIYHPYGRVGSLPWEGQANSADFGVDASAPALLQFAAQIKTFTEGTDPESSDILGIRGAMHGASRLVFLGFAFHRLNLALLWPDGFSPKNSSIPCYGTALGISAHNLAIITGEVANQAKLAGAALVKLDPRLKCGDLITEVSRSLTFR